jgi:hypothetical protein
MKPIGYLLLHGCAALVLVLGMVGCHGVNRLAEYDLDDQTLAVYTSLPSHPDVFTNDLLFYHHKNPLRTLLRIGSILIKENEAEQARVRIDSAQQFVDVAQRMAVQVLDRTAMYLNVVPIESTEQADLLLDIRVMTYGIEACSWQARAHFKIDSEVALIDLGSGGLIWKVRVHEEEPITPFMLGLHHHIASNLITAEALSRLSVGDMVGALEQLADYAADRITRKLQHDVDDAHMSRYPT